MIINHRRYFGHQEWEKRYRFVGLNVLMTALLLTLAPTGAQAQGAVPPSSPSVASELAAAPNPTIQLNPGPPAPLTATAPITLPPYSEAQGPQLTIDQAVQIGIDQNTQVAISRLTLKREKYQVQQVVGEAYPQLSFSTSDTYSKRNQSPGGVTQVQTNVNTSGFNVPTITDDQSGTSANTTTAETSSDTTTTSGAGSSTASSTVTVVPVTGPAGSSSSTTSSSDVVPADGAKATAAQTQTASNPILSTFVSTPYRLNNYGGELNLSQVIDIDGLVSTSEKLLQNEVTFYDLDVDRQQNEVAYSIKSQYFAVLRAEQQLTTDQEQVTNYQAELTDAQNRYNAGTAPAFDVISAQTELSNSQQALIDAEITLDVQRATLNNLLNRPIDTPFTPTTPEIPTLPNDATDAGAVAVANSHRPELREADIAIEIANKIERLDHAGQLPQMAVTAGLVYSGYASFPNGQGTSGNITAAVTLPLFDGGQTKALINEAKTNVQIEQETSEQLHSSVALEVRSAFVNVRNGSALVAANVQGVAEARESLRLANIRYKAGTGTLLEVTNAEADLATAETNLATAQFQLQTEYASLLRSEGLR